VSAEDALAVAAVASDKMRSVTLSASFPPPPRLRAAICKCASALFAHHWLFVLLVGACRGGSIQRALRRMAGGGGRTAAASERRECGDALGPASCSVVRSRSLMIKFRSFFWLCSLQLFFLLSDNCKCRCTWFVVSPNAWIFSCDKFVVKCSKF
jgi:hypothetical protein